MSKWYDYIAEPNFADAIMDRLINNATHIELKRESMRKRWKKITMFAKGNYRRSNGTYYYAATGILYSATAGTITPLSSSDFSIEEFSPG